MTYGAKSQAAVVMMMLLGIGLLRDVGTAVGQTIMRRGGERERVDPIC